MSAKTAAEVRKTCVVQGLVHDAKVAASDLLAHFHVLSKELALCMQCEPATVSMTNHQQTSFKVFDT
jgi:hypothetical protein